MSALKYSKKDSLKAAFEHRDPVGRVPLWELHFHLWNKYSASQMVAGTDYLALSEKEKAYHLRQNAAIMIDVADQLGFSGVTIPDSPWDCWYTLPFEDRLRLVRHLKAENPDFLIIAGSGGVIAMPDSSNYVDFCYTLMDEPEAIDKLCQKSIQGGRENLARFAEAGLDAAYAAADMADNRGPFFSPEQMQRFILPYLAEWTVAARSQGIYPILHTDGNISLLLEDLAATGICAVQAIDPVAGMDIRAVKAQMGSRLCLCGNVDCGELIMATPARLYETTRSLLADCKPGGCFVLGASNAVVDMTPKENYDAVLQAWQDGGDY